MSDKKFWAVWRETGGGQPSKRHDSKDSAIIEASRLARQSGESYLVLEVIGIVMPVETPVAYSDVE